MSLVLLVVLHFGIYRGVLSIRNALGYGELLYGHDRSVLSWLPEPQRYQSRQTAKWHATLSLSESSL